MMHESLEYINETSQKAQPYIQLQKIDSVATFLGNDISINRKDKTLYINQNDYTEKMLRKFNIHDLHNPVFTPGEPGIKLHKDPNITVSEH